ncbi:CRAL-TRIO domain-containing protein [Mycena amicta]|nr:CRAL-TRIO domain-containing protein [Mycena amicta]
MATLAASASALPAGITDPNYQPPPGRLGNLTVPQQHALEKIKKELKEEGHYDETNPRMDDATMLRFLRARKFDVPKTKEMFIANEKWRKEFNVDDIVNNFSFGELAEVDKYYPQYYHKSDKVGLTTARPTMLSHAQDGRPIYIERLGLLDLKALYAATTQERLVKRLVLEYEKFITDRLPACSLAAGHPVETSCTILDLQNVSISNFYRVKDYVMEASGIGQNQYPETMGKFYVINAPWAFSAVFAIIKPWLDEVTVKKIDILGGSYKDKLLAQIDAENLPKDFGGKCSCPGGCSLSDAGPWNKVVESEDAGKVHSA